MIYENKTKQQVNQFLDELNLLLRKNNFYINFMDGGLYHNQSNFCGVLEDAKVSLLLLDETTGLTLHETKQYDNK